MVLATSLLRHDRWTPTRLAAHQQRLLASLVRHAAEHAPFYRELYAPLDLSGEIRLTDLPVIGKARVMENFDNIVTDSRLRLADLRAHLKELSSDRYYLGDYRALVTAGTTGRRGIFVFDRPAWRHVLAGAVRWQAFMGLWPAWPRSLRFCTIDAPGPVHVSARMTESSNVGLFPFLRLRAIQPLGDLVDALNVFRPDVLITYPTLAVLLARAQLAGELKIAPRCISTHGELLTPAMADTIDDAWHNRPYDHYGLTELPNAAIECSAHKGLHVLSDEAIIEVVDDDYQPVEPGRTGSRVLITNLYNRAQPLIRYEASDLLVVSPEPCPCGRPFPLIERIDGRSGDIIDVPAHDGGTVRVSPMVLLNLIDGDTQLRESRVSFDADRLVLDVVPEPGVDQQQLAARLRDAYGGMFARMGAREPAIDVRFVANLERKAARMGKADRLVIGDPPDADDAQPPG